nr:MAG TPA: hypothetical protein [Caudoviricetes sp.]
MRRLPCYRRKNRMRLNPAENSGILVLFWLSRSCYR